VAVILLGAGSLERGRLAGRASSRPAAAGEPLRPAGTGVSTSAGTTTASGLAARTTTAAALARAGITPSAGATTAAGHWKASG